jgi:hypothetical protein
MFCEAWKGCHSIGEKEMEKKTRHLGLFWIEMTVAME